MEEELAKHKLRTSKEKQFVDFPFRYVGNKYKFSGSGAPMIANVFDIIPNDMVNYYEPFCGTAAIGINVLHNKRLYPNLEKVVLSDTNKDVVLLLNYIKDEPEKVLEIVYDTYVNGMNKEIHKELGKKYEKNPESIEGIVSKAIKTTNSYGCDPKGGFHPDRKREYSTRDKFDKWLKNLIKRHNTYIMYVSQALNNPEVDVQIIQEDYLNIRNSFEKGSFILLDPPYKESIIKYNNTNKLDINSILYEDLKIHKNDYNYLLFDYFAYIGENMNEKYISIRKQQPEDYCFSISSYKFPIHHGDKNNVNNEQKALEGILYSKSLDKPIKLNVVKP
ncbi:MAG: DNA adenine methylase [Methanobrevibacter sp. CfCl-M3]